MLAPLKISVPTPDLITLPPPEITPEKVSDAVLLIVNVAEPRVTTPDPASAADWLLLFRLRVPLAVMS